MCKPVNKTTLRHQVKYHFHGKGFYFYILIFVSGSRNTLYSAELSDVDTRTWIPGSDITIRGDIYIPSTLPLGQYEILLKLANPFSPASLLSDYNILMAYEHGPEYKRGLNNLLVILSVLEPYPDKLPAMKALATTPEFTPSSPQTPSCYSRVFCEYGSGIDCPTPDTSPETCRNFPVPNPGFENCFLSWTLTGNVSLSEEVSHTGLISAKMIGDSRVRQVFRFSNDEKAFELSAHAYLVDSASSGELKIYCDVKMVSGTNFNGQTAKWPAGVNNEWLKATLTFPSPGQTDEVIQSMWCYVINSHPAPAAVYVDDFTLVTSTDSKTRC